jgi:hypothetical protein
MYPGAIDRDSLKTTLCYVFVVPSQVLYGRDWKPVLCGHASVVGQGCGRVQWSVNFVRMSERDKLACTPPIRYDVSTHTPLTPLCLAEPRLGGVMSALLTSADLVRGAN